jgi:hypothetical protein
MAHSVNLLRRDGILGLEATPAIWRERRLWMRRLRGSGQGGT